MKRWPMILVAMLALTCAASLLLPPVKAVRELAHAPGMEAPLVDASQRQLLHMPHRATGALQAAFGVQGAGEAQVVWRENFDDGMTQWVVDADAENAITWKLTKTTGSGKAFSEIDPADVQSLEVTGPYQVYRRGVSSLTGQPFTVPNGGTLNAYIYFSVNLNDYAVLSLSISTDDFATSHEVWNSTQALQEKGAKWHKITVDLSAFSGKTVKLRFTYGAGTKDDMKVGGYMADFKIDGLEVKGLAEVDAINVTTGEQVQFIDLSHGLPVKWQWIFAGGSPATSSDPCPLVQYTQEGKHDVTLTVTDAGGRNSTITRQAFVNVQGTAPVARILPPATFRFSKTHLPMIAPLVPVHFADASTGFPTAWQWTFTGSTPATSTEQNPWVSYDFMHNQSVSLEVSNSHGKSRDSIEVSVEYEGFVNNLLSGDVPTTYSLEGEGTFPGDNKMKIDAYAEHFSKPSRPIMVYGATVYFVTAKGTSVSDQIANVGVHLYSAKDGKPDQKIASAWWRVFELETGSGSNLKGTWFEFSPKVIHDDFFLVVDGIPEHNDSVDVSFAMASMRNHGNTAYFHNREGWRPVTGYFSQDKGQSSFYIFPLIAHSAITLLPVGTQQIEVPSSQGSINQQIFSMFGYKTPVESDAQWCRVINKPNGLTLDTLTIAYDALPQGIESRTAQLRLTDGMDSICVLVRQCSKTLKGDLNADGNVDAGDVTCLINHILAHSKETSAQFDLNGDGKVDVSDVTMLIELALKPTS